MTKTTSEHSFKRTQKTSLIKSKKNQNASFLEMCISIKKNNNKEKNQPNLILIKI